MNRLRLAILASTVLLWALPLRAATVAIVQPPTQTPELTDTVSRLHGELLAVGLEVKRVARSTTRGSGRFDSRAWLEAIAAEGDIDAVIDIVGDKAPIAVDVWVIERSPRRFEVSRVALEPNTRNASERLAIRAIEVLRSSFLENEMTAREQQSEPLPERTPEPLPRAEQGEREEPAGRVESLGFELGAAVLTSLDGVGPAILPMARFDWRARSWFVVQAAVAGLGSRPTVATTVGNARVAQHYGVLGGCFRLRPAQRLWPFLAFSAGALRTSVEGQADSPRQGHTADQWSFLLDGSMGVGLHLPGPYTVTVAAHVQVAEPYVAIHFVDEVVATSGRPNLALTLTLGAWL